MHAVVGSYLSFLPILVHGKHAPDPVAVASPCTVASPSSSAVTSALPADASPANARILAIEPPCAGVPGRAPPCTYHNAGTREHDCACTNRVLLLSCL